RVFRPALILAFILAAANRRCDLGRRQAAFPRPGATPVAFRLRGPVLARWANLIEPVVLVRGSLAGMGGAGNERQHQRDCAKDIPRHFPAPCQFEGTSRALATMSSEQTTDSVTSSHGREGDIAAQHRSSDPKKSRGQDEERGAMDMERMLHA